MAIWLETLSEAPKRFASREDIECCRRLHRRHGTTYYFATRCLPKRIRQRTHALYAFVRAPDEWVDNPIPPSDPNELLDNYRQELLNGFEGVRPGTPALRAFCDLALETGIPLKEPLLFLDSMQQDLSVSEYAHYQDLRTYMRGSAAAVGVMMCYALGADISPRVLSCAKSFGEAMQLTNFLRDIAEDARRGRTYIPLEDLDSFGLERGDLCRVRPDFIDLMRFEIARARALYRQAEEGIALLPPPAQPAIRLASILYERILDRIEAARYNVFAGRVRTSRVEKITVAASVLCRTPRP